MVDTLIGFDMRAPSFGPPPRDLYAAALEMASFADRGGIKRISITEHHGAEDGYIPSPFLMGAAFAARTKQARIMIGAVILPLHDPVDVAEQIAVLDLLCGGRLEVIFGAGYVPSEFALFRVPINERGKRLDEGIEIIIRALSGERFTAGGREVFVRPLPLQKPHPVFFAGGGVEATARRAARFGIGLWPLRPELYDVYDAECKKLGRAPGPKLKTGLPLSVHVTEDPDKGWAELWPHARHVAESYARWEAESTNSSSPFQGLDDPAALKASGMFRVVTPDECVALARQVHDAGDVFVIQPLLGGLPPDLGWRSLDLFVTKVMPRLS